MKTIRFFICTFLSYMLVACSFENNPPLPTVMYDSETSELVIIQNDTAAHDTAYIEMEGLYENQIAIKDTIKLFFNKIVKDFEEIKYAYKLACNDNCLSLSIKTSRTNDTIFNYKHKVIDIKPISVANVVSGNCMGLYDVNYTRDYTDVIRLWIFKHKINPDSLLIEKTNSLLKQFHYSGRDEYSVKSLDIPIVTSLLNTKYKFDVDLPGTYFYLYACQTQKEIEAFIEKKVSEGLTDAHSSSKDEFVCYQEGYSGPNVLFMIGIDDNWTYKIVPCGMVFVDNMPPKFQKLGVRSRIQSLLIIAMSSDVNYPGPKGDWPSSIYLKNQNIYVSFPYPSKEITSSVSISYGDFQGNEYFGYNIPFYVSKSGDLQSVTIGGHTLNASNIRNGDCIRIHMKGLHIGDNSISLSANDVRGNKSKSSLSIPIVSISNNSSYDDDDYDDLDDRISDLEDRLDELE